MEETKAINSAELMTDTDEVMKYINKGSINVKPNAQLRKPAKRKKIAEGAPSVKEPGEKEPASENEAVAEDMSTETAIQKELNVPAPVKFVKIKAAPKNKLEALTRRINNLKAPSIPIMPSKILSKFSIPKLDDTYSVKKQKKDKHVKFGKYLNTFILLVQD